MNRGADPARSRRALLCIANSPRDAWEGALRGWFDKVLPEAWRDHLPTLVVVPTSTHAHALKAHLLKERRSHLGVRFVTPAALRELLADAHEQSTPSREHLRLLLATAAEEILREPASGEGDAEQLAAKSVVRTPDHLLGTLERLATAGWEFNRLEIRAFEPIVRRFRQHLARLEFHLGGHSDAAHLARAQEAPPRFAHVLIAGFDGSHWAQWFLLRAAVAASQDATVVLDSPREAASPDGAWVGSWEEALGEAVAVHDASTSTGDSLFSDSEMRGTSRSAPRFTFLVGTNSSQQAEAIALQAMRFVAEPRASRVAVIFARSGVLPRLVADALSRSGIPHNDAVAHPLPGLFESAEWRTWLDLQRGPRIDSLSRFLSAFNRCDEVFFGLRSRVIERALRKAHSEILLDDLILLADFCALEPGGTRELVAQAIRALPFLPARGTLSEFLAQTRDAFAHLGWEQHWTEIANRSGSWTDRFASELSRTIYLRWLEETAATTSAGRSPAGSHPYARVHLLTLPQARGQEWSHIIFAGGNEGSWPPPAPGEFARDQEIDAFNRGIQQLNQRAARQGRQGEGHVSVRAGHALYLGPAEQRQIACRQFDSLVEEATEAIAFTASLVQENAPERPWNPSELFTRLYQETHHAALTQAAMASLQRATERWLQDARKVTAKRELPSVAVEQTRVAFDARRDVEVQAGEYDFAFRSTPPRTPQLSVSDLERMVAAPALVWMKHYLGVEAPDESGNPWAAATGQWVHRWLASMGGAAEARSFARMPSASEIDRHICEAAESKRALITKLCAAHGTNVPDWWISGWQNALGSARHLAGKIVTAEEWRWMATEWRIDGGEPVPLAENEALSFAGQIDLLLSRSESMPEGLTSDELWIIDYKTGSNRALASDNEDVEKRSAALRKRLVKGEALQLALYGLAVTHRGAGEALLSIISRMVKQIAPQLSSRDMAEHADVFAELGRMQRTGVFGSFGAIRSAFGYARAYPLATLAVDPDLLDEKWELTHPALAREEEEFDWR